MLEPICPVRNCFKQNRLEAVSYQFWNNNNFGKSHTGTTVLLMNKITLHCIAS